MIKRGPRQKDLETFFLLWLGQCCHGGHAIHGITRSGHVGHIGVLVHAQACLKVSEEPPRLWRLNSLALCFDHLGILGHLHPLELLHRCVWDQYPLLLPAAHLEKKNKMKRI